jgi:hypothetical protein
MPQTANSAHIYIRRGGYAPSTSLHVKNAGITLFDVITAAVTEFRALIPTDVTVDYAELQDANGNVLDTAAINLAGTWDGVWTAFTDCTHITWISDGPAKPSGMFIHPRPYNAFALGNPTTAWSIAMTEFATAVTNSGIFADSEGSILTGMKRFTPSRRPKVRLAP